MLILIVCSFVLQICVQSCIDVVAVVEINSKSKMLSDCVNVCVGT